MSPGLEADQIRSLYAISRSIRSGGSLSELVERALSTYVAELDCTLGAVFVSDGADRSPESADFSDADPGLAPDGSEYEPLVTVPTDAAAAPAYAAAVDRVGAGESLPIAGETDAGVGYHVTALPGFGAILLAAPDGGLSDGVRTAIEPLNKSLAATCRARRTEAALRERSAWFEALFERSGEPMLVTDDDPVETVVDANEAFIEAFGYDRGELVGEPVASLSLPQRSPDSTDPTVSDPLLSGAGRLFRHSSEDGTTIFLCRTVPVEAAAAERLWFYIDVTTEYRRRERIRGLYEATDGILAAQSTEAICDRTVATAAETLDLALAGVHLYDRRAEALVPVATTIGVEERLDGLDSFTDTETIVWEAYKEGARLVEDLSAVTTAKDDIEAESAIIVPLGEHGVFIASSLESEAFDETDFRYAQLLAQFVETALTRATREQGLAAVQEITRSALDEDSVEAIARTVMDRLPGALGFPICTIWRYDPATDALEPVAATAMAERLLGTVPTIGRGDGLAWRVYESGETAVVDDIAAAPERYNDETVIGSEILVPLGEFGVVATGSRRPESFTETDRRLVETLAKNVETAIELVEQRRETNLVEQILARVLRHNLRNHLTLIQGRAEMVADADDESAATHADEILRSAEKLTELADSAREMRDVVDVREETTTLDLAAAARRAVAPTRDRSPNATVELAVEAEPTVRAHPAVATAIEHLVRNGIEHTDASGGTPTVAVTVTATDERGIVTVCDDGPGIPDAELAVLTDGTESPLRHGSGAGLWIVNRVLEYSNADGTFETDDGTTVTLRFVRTS